MSTIRVDTITDEAGTGAPNFPNGATGLPDPFNYTAVSGATQELDVGSHNFFDAGTLTADTTVSFSNVPTEARWTYTAEAAVVTAFDLSSGYFNNSSFSVVAQDTSSATILFKPDGTRFYIVGRQFDKVYQYSLSTAWNLNTATYDGVGLNVGSQNSDPWGVYFKPDGTKMYMCGYTSNAVYQYSLSTAWDLSSASYDNVSFSVSAQTTIARNPVFKSDGTKIYIIGTDNDRVYQYSLSTAWDLSSASYDNVSFSVNSQEANAVSLAFSTDGTKMFVVGNISDTIFEYSLSTAWDLSTASYSGDNLSVSAQCPNPYGIYLTPDGLYAFVLDGGKNSVFKFAIGTSTSITVPSSVENTPTGLYIAGDKVSYTFYTADGGTTVKLINEEVL